MQSRTIFHVDMDAFFASVEIVRNPALRGKPVIVGGLPIKRGVVSTCSYEARAYGIHSAMSLFEAKKRCSHAIFIEGNYSLYREYSDRILAIFKTFTPKVEAISIDEAYLDVSQLVTSQCSPRYLGKSLREAVFSSTQLTCSVGIASNKLIAKIASSLAKPNGLYEVSSGYEEPFLALLPIQSLPGVGEKTQLILNGDGFKTIADLQKLSLDALIQAYGARGYDFFLAAHGYDTRPVSWEDQPPKSIGAETTFETDLSERKILLESLKELVEKAWSRLRKNKMRSRAITLKLRYGNFKTINRSHTLITHCNDLNMFLEEFTDLFDRYYSGDPPLRLIGVSLEKLTDSYWQPTFW